MSVGIVSAISDLVCVMRRIRAAFFMESDTDHCDYCTTNAPFVFKRHPNGEGNCLVRQGAREGSLALHLAARVVSLTPLPKSLMNCRNYISYCFSLVLLEGGGGSVLPPPSVGFSYATCRLLVTEKTPGTLFAWMPASSLSILLLTTPTSVTSPLSTMM